MLEGGARVGRGQGRQALSHPRRRVGPSTGRSRLRQLGARGAAQEQELGVFFDYVIVCTVTGSTHAGMIAGTAPREGRRSVIGIDASGTLEKTVDQVTRIARATADRDRRRARPARRRDHVVDGYAGPAYGIPDEPTIEAIHLAARTEGMLTDPVYEGKSMAGLIGMVRAGEIPSGSRVLYAHLGGSRAERLQLHVPQRLADQGCRACSRAAPV